MNACKEGTMNPVASGKRNGSPLRGLKEMFGRRVWELRRRRGYTQADMAKRMKLHWTYIGGLERGERIESAHLAPQFRADLHRIVFCAGLRVVVPKCGPLW